MASSSHHSSKFRHIWGDPAKARDQYTDIKNPMTSGESQYVKANSKFFAFGKAGGGAPLYVERLDNPGRLKGGKRYISTHKGRLTDFDFHPFIDTMVATASDDCKINVTSFPEEGITETIHKADVVIAGHRKKISQLQFNPAANNILASGSYDRTMRIFNIETAAQLSCFDAFKDNIYSIQWNKDGSMVAVTSKDKQLRLFDPRQADAAQSVQAFDGIKSSKVFFVPAFNWIGCSGFSKVAKRQLKLWDMRNLNSEKPLFSTNIDSAASVLIPRFDADLNVLFLAGKGDNSVSFYEIVNDDKKVHYLSTYRDGVAQKGGGWVPKRGLDVFKCEVQRFMKLTKQSVIPVSFIVPRKSGADVFQEDIYPDCPSWTPAVSADEWSAGTNKDRCLMTMDPEKRNDGDGGAATFEKKKTYDEVCEENKQLQAQIAAMQQTIDDLKSQLGQSDEKQQDE